MFLSRVRAPVITQKNLRGFTSSDRVPFPVENHLKAITLTSELLCSFHISCCNPKKASQRSCLLPEKHVIPHIQRALLSTFTESDETPFYSQPGKISGAPEHQERRPQKAEPRVVPLLRRPQMFTIP